jgi:signal transduction histidine kinase
MDESHLFSSALLIEDDASHAKLIKRPLEHFVSTVEEAGSLAKASQMLTDKKPALIVSDLNLPDGKGTSLLESIMAKAPGVPVIVLTSSNSLSDAVGAMRAGARDFIVKEFDSCFQEVLGIALTRVASLQLMQAERDRLQREMEALNAAVESSNDGLAVVDSDGKVSYSNQSYRVVVSTLGGDPQNLAAGFGAQVARAVRLNDALRTHLKDLAAGAVWSTELHRTESKEMAFDLSISAISGKSADGRRVVWIRDIGERKRREKFQREILSTTTHDLKGPLGTISLCAEMMLDMVQNDTKLKEFVLRVASSSRSAINLIDEFLSARRIQEGSLILKPIKVDLAALIEEAIADYASQAEAKKITLAFHATGKERNATVDKLGMTRVLGNLISNAIKFTPTGGRIDIGLQGDAESTEISIADTGQGIDAANVQKLFGRFSRLDQHQAVEGTGLGLFVVKSIVSAHGGRIEVRSRVGEGTTFTILLPAEPPVNERGELVSLAFG